VHDALFVRVGESTCDIAKNCRALLEWNATSSDVHAQRLATHERHRVERESAHRLSGGEYRHDVWFLERGGELELSREARGRETVGELGRQNFHDDFAAERFVVSDEHAGHAAAAQLSLYCIGAPESLLELVEKIVQGVLEAGAQSNVWPKSRIRPSFNCNL